MAHWSLITLCEKLARIDARLVRHACYAVFQMAEVAVPKDLLCRILASIANLRW